MVKTVSLEEFRSNLTKLMDEVDKRMARIFVTRRGRPVGVLMSVDDLEGLEETIDIMSDKAL